MPGMRDAAPSSNDHPPSDEMWRQLLVDQAPFLSRRRMHARIPSSPRCKLCAASFSGPGGLVMRYLGHARWAKNPKYCTACFGMIRRHHGGAEIECTLLFADVRGSTSLAESMSAGAFREVMERYYDTAAQTVFDN